VDNPGEETTNIPYASGSNTSDETGDLSYMGFVTASEASSFALSLGLGKVPVSIPLDKLFQKASKSFRGLTVLFPGEIEVFLSPEGVRSINEACLDARKDFDNFLDSSEQISIELEIHPIYASTIQSLLAPFRNILDIELCRVTDDLNGSTLLFINAIPAPEIANADYALPHFVDACSEIRHIACFGAQPRLFDSVEWYLSDKEPITMCAKTQTFSR